MADPILSVSGFSAFYGDFQAIFDVSFDVPAGEVLAVIGSNGAGKSTTMRAICGLLPVREPDMIRFRGEPIGGLSANRIVARGITMVPEGRRLFPSLSVEENLLIGGQMKRPGPWSIDRVFELFPVLKERRRAPATALSGGQQQMVAISRALMSNPELILFDEISLGLAPVVINDIYEQLPNIVSDGMTALIVEQDITRALSVADRVICLQEGRLSLAGSPDALSRDEITAAYFGS